MKYEILFSILLVLFSSSAKACRCGASIEDNVENYSIIFFGKAIKAELVDESTVLTTFDVLEKFKGTVKNKLVVRSGADFACEIHFVIPETYLIFTDKDGYVSMCGGSKQHNPSWYPEEISEIKLLIEKQKPNNAKQ